MMQALGDIADIKQGRYLAKHEMADERSSTNPVPVHGANGIIGWTDKAMYPAGVPLVTCRGSNSGMVLWAEGPLWVSNNAMAILPKNGVTRFAYYLLKNSPPYETVSGSAQPQITRAALAPKRVFWPDEADQLTIARVLGFLDDKIELNRQTNETLEAMVQAIFRDWFVDFGPVRRKMEGATDPVVIMAGLTPDPGRAAELAALFPSSFDADLPLGWRHRNFGDLLATSKGGEWGSEAWSEACPVQARVVRGTDFQDLEGGFVGKVPVRFLSEKKAGSRLLLPGDIILEASGGSPSQPTGRSLLIAASILARLGGTAVPTSFCRLLRPASKPEGSLAFEHLRALYASGGTWEYQNQSTGIANFQTTYFLTSEFVVWPGNEVAELFAAVVQPMRARIASNQNMALAETRDYILPRLMSGQVSIRENL